MTYLGPYTWNQGSADEELFSEAAAYQVISLEEGRHTLSYTLDDQLTVEDYTKWKDLKQNTEYKYVSYCASHILVQPNFRRYYFYFLSDQAQTHLVHWKVLDKLCCKISFKSGNG